MKAEVISIDGEKKEIELPKIFESEIRKDLIELVWYVQRERKKQPYGAYVLAGKEVSASGKVKHRRRKYKTLYGYGISRVPRKILTRRGERFYWIAAFAPGTVGGRAAHPPKATKRKIKVNKKVKRLALKSAIAATANLDVLKEKYKEVKVSKLPVVISSESLSKKPKEIANFLKKILGIEKKKKKVRAGKGKRRGRRYKGLGKPLIIIGNEEKLKIKSYGFDVIKANQLNIEALAPGGKPGRLVVWTEKAIEEVGKIK